MQAALSAAVAAVCGVVAFAGSPATPAHAVDSSADVPSTHLYNGSRMSWARDALLAVPPPAFANTTSMLGLSLQDLRSNAAKVAADTTVWSVMNKTLSVPGISPHNYLSIGIYNHPCNNLPEGCTPYPGNKPYPKPFPPSMCDNSTGLPWYPCDGQRNSAAIEEGDAPRQSSMVSALQTLGLGAFYSSNGSESAPLIARAKDIAYTWFLNNATAMLPNLYFGQIKPAASPPNPGHGGFIEWSRTAELLDALELLRFSDARDGGDGGWTPDFHEELQAWWVKFEEYVVSKYAAGERSMTNNHGSWFDVDWQSVALFIGNVTAASEAGHEVCTQRIAKQILPSGEEWIELERAVPSGYCQYNLEALVQDADLAASLPNASAVDVWGFTTSDGRSLMKSIEWLTPYATGAAKWPYGQKVPEATSWTGMNEVLRRTSLATNSRDYEVAACEVMKNANDSKSYFTNNMNLVLPPSFFLNETCQ